ncbi:response regulator [Cytophagaceae bacterium ABcell3]|nr:response regulator [Cytophagaceae bacterium ABcell3]
MAKIIIVDDSLYMRTMLKHILTDAGHEVVGEAPDAKNAIRIIEEKKPDIVTLDIILPDSTGLDVLKTIRAQNTLLKIVMVTAVGQEVIMEEAQGLGAIDYILKPFSEEKVAKVINKVAGSLAY